MAKVRYLIKGKEYSKEVFIDRLWEQCKVLGFEEGAKYMADKMTTLSECACSFDDGWYYISSESKVKEEQELSTTEVLAKIKVLEKQEEALEKALDELFILKRKAQVEFEEFEHWETNPMHLVRKTVLEAYTGAFENVYIKLNDLRFEAIDLWEKI